jgi:hypothetical protein
MNRFQDYDPSVIVIFLEISFAILAILAVLAWVKGRKKGKK